MSTKLYTRREIGNRGETAEQPKKKLVLCSVLDVVNNDEVNNRDTTIVQCALLEVADKEVMSYGGHANRMQYRGVSRKHYKLRGC